MVKNSEIGLIFRNGTHFSPEKSVSIFHFYSTKHEPHRCNEPRVRCCSRSSVIETRSRYDDQNEFRFRIEPMEVKRLMKVSTIGIVGAVAVAIVLASSLFLVPNSFFQHSNSPTASSPCIQKAYSNGNEYCFTVLKAIPNASQAIQGNAVPLYVLTYPQFNSICSGNISACKTQSLPSGYFPQCDPCIQEAHFPYHDHILSGPLKLGINESYVVVVLTYNPAHSNQANFVPINNSSALAAAEQAGDFTQINPGASNPYEMYTRMVLVIEVQSMS